SLGGGEFLQKFLLALCRNRHRDLPFFMEEWDAHGRDVVQRGPELHGARRNAAAHIVETAAKSQHKYGIEVPVSVFAQSRGMFRPVWKKPDDGNGYDAFQAVAVKCARDFRIKRPAQHALDNLGSEAPLAATPAEPRHEFPPDDLEDIRLEAPGQGQPALGMGESAILRCVGGKLMDSKTDRLRRLVREAEFGS